MFSQRKLNNVPIDDKTFNGSFSPGDPLNVSPIEGEPRQWVYRPGYNLTTPQSDKPVSFEYLRKISRDYDLLARCLSRRKEELRTLHWSIQPRERKNKKRMREVQEKNSDLIADIERFFKHPEGYMKRVKGKWVRMPIKDYQSWLNAILDDLFVIDTIALYPRRKMNQELLALERVAGETIKPLLGIDGRTPLPPDPAFQQFVYGVPRQNFTVEELIYRVYNPSNHSAYGYSVVEQILTFVKMAMNNEKYIESYFSEGSIPEILFQVPAEWNQAQLEEFADYMNARLKGNPHALREFNPIPNGTKPIELRPFNWDSKFVNWVATMTCVLAGVQPHEMGIVPQESGLGGKSFGEIASDIHDKQTTYVAEFLQSLFTDIIQFHFGCDDLCFVFDHLLEKDEKDRAEINDILIKSGQKSIDQILVENGEEPEGINRIYVVGDRIYGLPDLLALSVKGATAVNLGQIGGIPMPDDTFTENVTVTQDAANPDVVTPNPKQTEDAMSKVDTSDKEQPEQPKSAPPQPPKPKAKIPAGPTINTVKGAVADVTKDARDDSNDDDSQTTDEQRETHQEELIFIAAYLSLMKRVQWDEHLLTPNIIQSAFTMTHAKQLQLADALYELKRNVYIESHNTIAKSGDVDAIDNINAHTEAELRQEANQAAAQVAETYNADLQRAVGTLVDAGVTEPKHLVNELNDWLKQRNAWKSKQIAATEVTKPWNKAVFNVDKQLNRTDKRSYYVSPDDCKCSTCLSMVSGNPYTFDQAYALSIPSHPNCKHMIRSEPI